VNVYSAQIPWHLVKTLRAALDGLGLDWRKVKATEDARTREARAQQAREARS